MGNASQLHKERLASHFPTAQFSDNNDLVASGIAKIAKIKINKQELCNADTLLPLYLRKSQAERMAEQKNGKN